MAVKLEKTKTMSGDSRYSIKLTVTEKTVTSADIADNSTRVDYKLEATKSSGSGYYSNNAINPIKVTLDGTTIVNTKKTYDFRNSTPKTITLASGTHTIKHDPDGSKTIACSGYFKDADNSLGNATASGNLTLTQLHTPPVITGYSITETNSVLTNIGVSNNQFVGYLSNKRINITYNLDEDTQYQSALVYFEGGSQIAWNTTLPIIANFADFHPSPVNNNLNLCVSVTDDKNTTSYYSNASGSTSTRQALDSYTYIPYIIPTFNSSSNARRDGQLTGKVKLNITGTYYNGEIGSGANKVNQGGNYKPTIKYKFWKVGESQPSTYAYKIPDSSITTSNGTFTISNYQIGSTTETATNYFNPSYSYRVKLYIQDNFKNNESAELSIPVGEAVWTEYKDRVDFKKLTIQGVEVTPGGGGAGDYENLINKPEINGVTLSGDKTASQLGFASVATSGAYSDLSNKPTIPTKTSDLTNDSGFITSSYHDSTKQNTLVSGTSIKTINNTSLLGSGNISITQPTKTSQLTNDSNFVSDASYVHTDNNYTTTEKNKLSGIASGAEVNVQSNWNETNTSSDAFIKNKPTIPSKTSQLTNDSNYQTLNNIANDIKFNTISSILPRTGDGYDVVDNAELHKNSSGRAYININSIKYDDGNNYTDLKTVIDGKQPTLVSGTNIKTINNNSIVGSGNLSLNVITTITTSSVTLSDLSTGYYRLPTGCSILPFSDESAIYTTNKNALLSVDNNSTNLVIHFWLIDNYTDNINWGEDLKITHGVVHIEDGLWEINTTSFADFVKDSNYVHTDNNYTTTEKNKLAGITVNNGTLTIQKNGTNVQTFTANQSSNVTANITVPTTATQVNAIPNSFGTAISAGTDGARTDLVSYGNSLTNGAVKGINILNLGVNKAYRCYERGATVTCNYSNVVSSIGTQMFNGDYLGYQTAINPSTDFVSKPFVLEMTRPTSFEMTDVTRMLILGHRLYGTCKSSKYKIEVAYAYSNGVYSWATAVDYDSNTEVELCQKYYGLFCTSAGIENWHSIFGIRLTISKSSSTIFQIAEIMLFTGRGTEQPYEALHVVPDQGGKFYGNVEATRFIGLADKATGDKNGNDITTTYYKASNPNGYTSNTGTITGIKMNGASKGTSGVVDLGTVLTSHQSIKTINNTSLVGSGNVSVQPTLVSGTNIKTINNTSLLGSGNITISGGTATTVKINGTSITSNNEADIKTNGTYNASTNKIATMSDLEDLIYYKPRDIIELGDNAVPGLYVTNGYITSSAKIVIITFSVPKRLDNISSITVNNLNVEARGANGYLNSQSGYVEYVNKSSYTITAWVSSSNSISVQIIKSSAFSNISNNTLVSIAGHIKFTLS